MATIMTVYDRKGVPIAELPGLLVIYADEINTASKAIVSVPITSPLLTEDNFHIRNFVLINDTYLGKWVGVISGNSQEWFMDRVEFTIWDVSYLLNFRRTPEVILDGSSGDIFGALIDMANAPENLLFVRDTLWTDGAQTTLSLKYDMIYSTLRAFAARTGGEWLFVPQLTSGRLSILAQWHKRIGKIRDFTLTYPSDFAAPGGSIMSVGTDPINNMLVFGAGATQGNTPVSQPDTGTEDSASRSKYGLMQGVSTNNMVVQASLDAEANAQLEAYKEPRKTFKINGVRNSTKKTFENLGLGDIIRISLAGIGFNNEGGLGTEAYVRIVAREYSPHKQTLSLTVDEVVL